MRKMTMLGLASAAFLLAAGSAPAQAWEYLGSRTVGFAVDRDAISARGEGAFRRIRLCVEGNAIEMFDLDVVFGNGGRQDVQVRDIIRPGTCTRAIDLRGRARNIRRVVMVYRSIPNFRGQAVVNLYGIR